MKCCPIDNTFKLIGKKFTVLIIRNILSARLKEMEKSGLIQRKVYAGTPIKIEYFLTEKGRALKSILDQMASFSMQYCAKDVFNDAKPRVLQKKV